MTITPVLSTKSLGLAYRDRWLVRDLALTVSSGDLVAVEGRNGAGKTTLLRTLLGLRQPQRGTIARMVHWQIGENVGFVPQDSLSTLLPWFTAAENVLVGLLNLRPDTHSCAERPHVDQLARQLIGASFTGNVIAGVESLFGSRPVDSLSGGEQQKLVVLRTVLALPSVLVLDEPYRELDYGAAVAFRDYLTGFVDRGGAVVMVSHQDIGPGPTVRVNLQPEGVTTCLRIAS